MYNILINNISLVGEKENKYNSPADLINDPNRDVIKYTDLDGNVIEAFQTNEACFKCIESFLENRESAERIDMIISLVSKESKEQKMFYDRDKKWKKNEKPERTLSNYAWFTKEVNKYFEGSHKLNVTLKKIDLEDSERNISETYNKYINKIFEFIEGVNTNQKIRIILDVSGGKRDTANLLQLLTKLLSYHGHEVKAYYTEKNGKKGEFHDCTEFYKQLELLEIINEFIQNGNIFRFTGYFQNTKIETIRDLNRHLEKFSESVLLCSVKDIYESMHEIREDIELIKKLPDNDVDIRTLKMVADLLKNKFNTEYKDTPKRDIGVIKWCLDNNMYQQAATICYERIPVYLLDQKILPAHRNNLTEVQILNELADNKDNCRKVNNLTDIQKDICDDFKEIYKIRNKLNHALDGEKYKVTISKIKEAVETIFSDIEKAEKQKEKKDG